MYLLLVLTNFIQDVPNESFKTLWLKLLYCYFLTYYGSLWFVTEKYSFSSVDFFVGLVFDRNSDSPRKSCLTSKAPQSILQKFSVFSWYHPIFLLFFASAMLGDCRLFLPKHAFDFSSVTFDLFCSRSFFYIWCIFQLSPCLNSETFRRNMGHESLQ